MQVCGNLRMTPRNYSFAGLLGKQPPHGGALEAKMPIILWLLGVPLVVVIALMLTHVI
jgi:hypothetical protein